jgi:hypothetical protein
LPDHRELVVIHGHRAGQLHGSAILRGQSQIGDGALNGVRRLAAGLQRRKVQHRLHFDEVAQLCGLRRRALHQRLPRERCRLAREHVTQRLAGERERPGQLVEFQFPTLNAVGRKAQRLHRASQARIGRQGADEDVGARQARHRPLDVGQRLEQETVPLKEFSAVRLHDGSEQIGALCEFLLQGVSRLFGSLRRRCRHDHEDFLLRKSLCKFRLALAPRQIPGNEILRIGRDREVRNVKGRGSRRKQYSEDENPQGMTRAKVHDTNNRRAQHGVSFFREAPAACRWSRRSLPVPEGTVC